jgi:hypothetical protein
MELMMQWSF